MHKLGILLSGRGSNFLAIADAVDSGRIPDVRIAVVISNLADAPGLETARRRGLAAVAIEARGRKRAEHDEENRRHTEDATRLTWCVSLAISRLLSPGFHPGLLGAHPEHSSVAPPGLSGARRADAGL